MPTIRPYTFELYVAYDNGDNSESKQIRLFWDRDVAERNLLSNGVKNMTHLYEVDRMDAVGALKVEDGQVYATPYKSKATKHGRKPDDIVRRIYEACGMCSLNKSLFTSEEAAKEALDSPRIPMRDGGLSMVVTREMRIYERRDDSGEFVLM